MIKEAIVKIVDKQDLSYREAYTVMSEIMSGATSATQNAAFLAALSTKSTTAETTDEIAGGAAAISCLTEPKFFLGSDAYLTRVRQTVELPILRKDFTVDEYQIYEAKNLGADAVLLICSLLSAGQLAEYLCQVRELGLSALVEVHDAAEAGMAVAAGAEIIGVNNRNLKDFTVNPLNSLRLREQIPREKIFVAESGITQAGDTVALKAAGVQAVLIGESLMRAQNSAVLLQEMRGERI